MTLRDLPPFLPADFFEIEILVSQKFGKLPDYSSLLGEQAFAECHFRYHAKGIDLIFEGKEDFSALEVMIDTRGIKTSAVMHKYGHHFTLLPEVEEITKFHGDDRRPLIDGKLIKVENGRQLKVSFGEGALFGFDPEECPRIGFAYRIHRKEGAPQHFTVSSKYCKIEKTPALWAILRLT